MKKLFIIIAILAVTTMMAQEKTMFGSSPDISHGGFGAPVVKFTSINGEFGVLVGGRGGWLINHQISLGIAGYGLATNTQLDGFTDGEVRYLDFGYGGFELEYIMANNEVIHLTVSGLIGAGGTNYRFSKNYYDGYDWNDNEVNSDAFFVGEPTVNAELNVTTFFRINVGIGYRFISGSNNNYITDSELSGVSGQIQLKFGSF